MLCTAVLCDAAGNSSALAERLGITPIIAEGLRRSSWANIRPLPDDGQDSGSFGLKALQERQLDIVRIAG